MLVRAYHNEAIFHPVTFALKDLSNSLHLQLLLVGLKAKKQDTSTRLPQLIDKLTEVFVFGNDDSLFPVSIRENVDVQRARIGFTDIGDIVSVGTQRSNESPITTLVSEEFHDREEVE